MKIKLPMPACAAVMACVAMTGHGAIPLYKGHQAATVFGDGKWIGAPEDQLPFQPDRLTVFSIEFTLTTDKGSAARFIYGANDPRLMDSNMNIHGLANPRDSSFVAIDIIPDGTLHVSRRGYCLSDTTDIPVASFKVTNLMTDGSPNKIELKSNLGHTDIYVNGKEAGHCGLNPIGNGGDYLSFPALAEFGTDIPEGSNASIRDIKVRNFRKPSSTLLFLPGKAVNHKLVDGKERSMPELKTKFHINPEKKVKNASITVTARGIYDLYINGRHASSDYFNPDYTQYNKTHTYRTIDLTDLIKPGDNTLRAVLGEGWWSGPHTFVGENWNFYGDRQSLIANISVEYSDGEKNEFASSPDSWLVSTDGPVKAGSFFQGEIIDATITEQNRTWQPASEIPLEGTACPAIGDWSEIRFIPSGNDRVLPVDTLTAVGMTEPRSGVYVYDMGQNFAGVPLLYFSGLKPATEINIRYGEVLYPDMPRYAGNKGMVMTENLRAAMNHDIYKAAGGEEYFSPRLTLHGYRFIELTGLDKPLPLNSVKALPLSSIGTFKAGFKCSDSTVNRLWENIKWSTLSNFISIPTDCAQRNERLGWMGDISVYSPAATKLADLDDLLARYFISIRDCTHPDGRFPDVAPTGFGFGSMLWGSAGIIVPWEHYKQYGRKEVLSEHYPAMKRYIDYLLENTLDSDTGIIVQNRAWGDLGDWLSPVYDRDDKSLLWECYLIYNLGIMGNVAEILDDNDRSGLYKSLQAERIRLFADTYIDPLTKKTIHSAFIPDKEGTLVDTQASYALPIALGITNDKKMTENFINTLTRTDTSDNGINCPPYSLMTGFIGTAWISKALSKIRRPDLAYRILTSKEYPSWLYPVTQGATTIWERLDSYTHTNGFGANNSMNSFNHYSFGSVADWMLTHAIGIQASPGLSPGVVRIAPEPDTTGALTFARGYLDLPEGRVESGWEIENGIVTYEITVPENMTAYFSQFGGKTKKLKSGKHTIKSKQPIYEKVK